MLTIPKPKSGKVFIVITLLLLTSAAALRAQSAPKQLQSAGASLSQSSPAGSGFEGYTTGGWGGVRHRLVEKGFSFNAQLLLSVFGNFQGGVDTGAVGVSTFDLNLAVDTEKVFNWKGGEFYVDLEDHAGRNPSAVLAGDIQTFDKHNSAPYFQLFEMWYQQKLFDGRLRLKLGKVDANTEFSVVDNGLIFPNASTQVTPTITPFSTAPDPMPSADLFFTPVKSWYASFMVSYANRSDAFGVFTGHPQSIQPTRYGMLLLGETGLRWENDPLLGRDGNLKFGVWGHTGTFTRLKGGEKKGSGGFYGIFDQTLWQPPGEPKSGRGVRTFLEAGHTQPSVSVIDWNVAGGVTWTGPVYVRPEDIFAFSANYAHLNAQAGLPHSYELALEWLYQTPLTKWATLQPDIQFIIHPGGQYPDALLGTLDLTIQF